MDTQFIVCGSCNTRLKIPATVAPGKKVKCPKCSQVVTVPAAAASDPGYEVDQDVPAPAPLQPVTMAPAKRSCPYCGSQVIANAIKCRHCGEFLDEATAPAVAKTRAAVSTGDQLNPAEYIVATVFAPIGLFVGLFWKIKKLSKASDMLKVSGLCSVIFSVAGLLVYQYFFKKDIGLPTATTGVAVDPPIDYPPSVEEPPDHRPFPPSVIDLKPPSKEDLEKQPPHIQRAMRATVAIMSGPGLGTGVVIRREGSTALILTNQHVADPMYAATHGQVQSNNQQFPLNVRFVTNVDKIGKVVWKAQDGVDLALVEVNDAPEGVEAVSWQSTPELKYGDQVFAVGNPQGLGWTSTFGKVSAFREHDYPSRKVAVIQTDTRIGPGNSGGGLYTENGELVGINTFVAASSRADAGETGLGFAIRTSVLMDLKPDVLKSSIVGTNP